MRFSFFFSGIRTHNDSYKGCFSFKILDYYGELNTASQSM